jgi:ParB family chromosome partitioning protein
MELGKVFVDSVIVGKRHRALEVPKVDSLAESMKAIGLQQPISVYVDGEDAAFLVAGHHRLEAARKLGWEEIPATFVQMNPVEREMWEIAENLFRVDLSKEQRVAHIRRYAELLKERPQPPQSAAPVKPRGHAQTKGVVRTIANETGLSDDTVRRALNPAPPKLVTPRTVVNDDDSVVTQVNSLIAAWNRAGPEARQRFRDHIDEPVFENTRAGAR